MTATAWEVAAGVLLDLVLGDPQRMPHPVRAMGAWIAVQERWWRLQATPLRLAGVALWLGTVGASLVVVAFSLYLLPRPWIYIYWIYSLIAVRDLDQHAMQVVFALEEGDLVRARQRLAWIVGRDTQDLKESEVARAVIETVAENLSDGVVAPLFYLALGGPLLMAAYKAVNTLDSMVGYKNERYRELGWFSARADDWANWLPARLTVILIAIIAALLPGCSARDALRIAWRDGASQPSPNAGYPEAAMAGALGVRLGGENFYGGVLSRKAYLGDPRKELNAETCRRTRPLLYGVALLATLLVCLVEGG